MTLLHIIFHVCNIVCSLSNTTLFTLCYVLLCVSLYMLYVMCCSVFKFGTLSFTLLTVCCVATFPCLNSQEVKMRSKWGHNDRLSLLVLSQPRSNYRRGFHYTIQHSCELWIRISLKFTLYYAVQGWSYIL